MAIFALVDFIGLRIQLYLTVPLKLLEQAAVVGWIEISRGEF